ncbi:hypothetical protein Lalb_Chr22g0349901 [Lupinus albus]|uniref:Uncharacterized protein n=1 Tax=Lupinus albus TaxID=3870 RepID=A0A6A4NML8_LUPAL|nr:hypothetical protein Lalb_Chr22g0349901 [Lupinus albus]
MVPKSNKKWTSKVKHKTRKGGQTLIVHLSFIIIFKIILYCYENAGSLHVAIITNIILSF